MIKESWIGQKEIASMIPFLYSKKLVKQNILSISNYQLLEFIIKKYNPGKVIFVILIIFPARFITQ